MLALRPSPSLWKRLALLALTGWLPLAVQGQMLTPPAPTSEPVVHQPPDSAPLPPSPSERVPAPVTTTNSASSASASAIDQLTQSNRDLLDLLKKQQGVLEDMQFDRRLESRQIQNLEIRLTETLQQNAELQAKVAQLQTQLNAPPPTPLVPSPSPATPTATNTPPTPSIPPAPPPPPASYLPAAPVAGAPGTKSWHRLYTLSGTDNETSDPIHIVGRTWRVVWHNQDKDGDTYKNTSALFINAFAKGDTIPQKVCAKLGSGGDSTELIGPGDFELKIEASGGKWELAVEDFIDN